MEAPVSDERPDEERAATFREVFALREYRSILTATTLAWVGDYIAKAAVTVLVYRESESVALSAAAFAVGFLPWLIGGPLLATVAERYRYRHVMVACDLIRMTLVALVAIPGMPVWAILCLLFLTTLANPPSQAARSALLPLVLSGDRLVVGLSINASVGQAAQVVGYLLGAAIATINPTVALLVNATTFALSAVLVRLGVRDRPSAMTAAHRSHLLRETGEGFRLVFGDPTLRAIAVTVFSAMLFAIVPEGLAAAWAREGNTSGLDAGTAQAAIMAANPVGFILGGLLIGRAVAPARRVQLVRPLAVAAPLTLVPVLFDLPPLAVALLAAVCGAAVGGLLPVANGMFVRALPDGYRARAFGVMATGLQVIQGLAVLVTGLLAEWASIPVVVGVWSAAGVVLMLLVGASWPGRTRDGGRTPPRAATPAARQAEETAAPEVGGPTGQGPVGQRSRQADAPTR
ncbi:MFS transporter [Micromonospora fluostatini]|uniref:MFS transporter n=1 Tax=Micromonospora fluostatini TaxID=1629071 RepID=A0ABY2DGU3_9ACTN|nr:MFS transporter [Micromonospora fluostatini]